jgi:hypothetical protein
VDRRRFVPRVDDRQAFAVGDSQDFVLVVADQREDVGCSQFLQAADEKFRSGRHDF